MNHLTNKPRTFNFKEDCSKCSRHNEQIRYVCICREKLCNICIADNNHFGSHGNVKLIPFKELKRQYINEVDEMEIIYNEFEKGSDDEENSSSTLDCFIKSFVNFLKCVSEKYFKKLFDTQDKSIKDILSHINGNTKTPINLEIILDFMGNTDYYKDLLHQNLLKKFEKCAQIRKIFLEKMPKISKDLGGLIKKFFTTDENVSLSEESIEEAGKSLLSKSECHNYFGSPSPKFKISKSPVKKTKKNSNDIVIEEFDPPLALKLIPSTSTNKDNIESGMNSGISLYKTFIPHVNNFLSNSHSNGKKDGDLKYHFSKDNFNLNNFNEQNSFQVGREEDKALFDKTFRSMFFPNSPNDSETSIAEENRNRISKLIFKNKPGGFKTLNNFKSRIYNGFSELNYKNYLGATGILNNNSNFANSFTPTNPNGYGLNNLNIYSKQNCVTCLNPFKVIKAEAHWRKRCSNCQKNHHNKLSTSKYYSYNSYKAGKMNQICASCNSTFVVPVSLMKQRKTCYYCFKEGKTANKV